MENNIEEIIKIMIKNSKDPKEKEYLEGLLKYDKDIIDLETLEKIGEYQDLKTK